MDNISCFARYSSDTLFGVMVQTKCSADDAMPRFLQVLGVEDPQVLLRT